MNAPETTLQNDEFAAPAGYGGYAQLVKMLLPSSGCLAIYAANGDLSWCSEGFEKPEFGALIDQARQQERSLGANQGTLRKTVDGASVLIARLCDDGGMALGYLLIELGKGHTASGNTIAISLARPLITCLAAQIALERPVSLASVASPPPSPAPAQAVDSRLEFLLGIGEIDLNSPRAIRHLLRRCVDSLDCVSAVFCIPDQDLTEVAERASVTDDATRARLDRTRKHLLAWVQLNNRPMLVNRVDTHEAPYKILSCPVVGQEGTANGLLALFRAAERPNFEMDDVRLIEFASRQAMALLCERQDSLTGLMSRTAFERQLDEGMTASFRAPPGSLLYLDIEALKAINEAFGFAIGDEVILRTAQLIRRSLTPNESACRLAGDRFVVHLPERNGEEASILAAEIARSANDLGYTAEKRKVPLALRYGVAAAPSKTGGARHWIAAAERACQQARTDRSCTESL